MNKDFTKETADLLFSFLQNSFVKESSDKNKYIVSFDQDIVESKLIDNLNKLFILEHELYKEQNTEIEFILNIKNLNFDLKLQAIKLGLSFENLLNKNMLLNIYSLIKGKFEYSTDFFTVENIYFNDILEVINTKDKLNTEIVEFSNELFIYYLGLIRSIGILSVDFSKNTKDIPLLYANILSLCDFVSLSGIINRNKNFNIEWQDVPFVNNRHDILINLAKGYVFSDFIINDILDAPNVEDTRVEGKD